jgi:hypothetical protein
MVGKSGRSGRPKGSTSSFKNPVNIAAHNLSALMEMWLAGVPIPAGPNRYLLQPSKRRHTVPPKIKRALARIAIAKTLHDLGSTPESIPRPKLVEVLGRVRRRAPTSTLRRKVRPV